LNGLIAMFMRLEANVARIALEVAGEDERRRQRLRRLTFGLLGRS